LREANITSTQRKYYEIIRSFIETKGFSPSYSEIGRLAGGRTPGSVHSAVHNLIGQGYLELVKEKGCNRIALVPEKIHGMQNCAKGHPVIWYLSPACPLCDTLRRLIGKEQPFNYTIGH